MQNVNRTELLTQLTAVAPGLSTRDIIEQSACFAFKGGRVYTFNDEISCSIECPIKLEGAIASKPLLDLLSKMDEEVIQVEVKDEEVVVHGKRRKAGIRREAAVLLPIDTVETPTEWQELHPNFVEAFSLIQHAASKDASSFVITCVNITPKYVEACDNYQAARMKVRTGVSSSTLVRRDALKGIVSLGMTGVSETEKWIHFQNPMGLVYSCRRYTEQFPDLSPILDFEGTSVILPKGLAGAAEKANIFSSETSDDNFISVTLDAGRIKIRGQGASGWFQEVKKVEYTGPRMDFIMAPELLTELTQKHSNFEIGQGRLRVTSGKFQYVTCLASPTAGE